MLTLVIWFRRDAARLVAWTTGSTLPTSPEASQAAAARLSAMLIGGGAAHFLAPRWFDSLIPSQLPGSPRMYTVGSSLANLAVGAGLAIPRTRRPASLAAALLFVGYMPAKLKLAIDWWQSERTPVPAKVLGIVQLFWQVPLVTESLKALRNAPRPAPARSICSMDARSRSLPRDACGAPLGSQLGN